MINIVRPYDGFKLVEKPGVIETLESLSEQCDWLRQAYSDVIQLLRIAGHKAGQPSKDSAAYRHFSAADPNTNQTRLIISYHVLGDTLTVLAIKVVI